MEDRKLFNKTVYTPLSEAIKLLDERRKDPELMAKVEKLLKGDIPEILKNKKCGVLGRQIATPNHESERFISITQDNNLCPVFFEYYEDKFSSRNEYKHSLGQLRIMEKVNKKGYQNVEKLTIVDFNKYGSKKLREVKTRWNESLIDFHRKLFTAYGYNVNDLYFYEASKWYKDNGGKPIDYYINLFSMFTCFGIYFENFLTLTDSEGDFTKNIVLPALEKVINLVGVKPLIVPLAPLDLEADNLWYHHLLKVKELIPHYKS